MALGITGATSGITSNQATLTGTVSGAAAGQPVGMEFYNADDDSLINTAATQAVVSGTLHLAIKDGEAMFFHDSIDFSALVGRLIMFTDAAGKRAWAYGGSVGGGEALGANVAVNGSFSTDTNWTKGGAATISDGVVSFTNNNDYVSQQLTLLIAQTNIIIKFQIDINSIAPNDSLWMYIDYAADGKIVASSLGSNCGYLTPARIQNHAFVFLKSGSNGLMTIDNAVVANLTDVPSTGLRLVSTSGGEIRNFAMVETGFNVNTVVSVRSWSNSTIGAGSAGMDWVGLSAVTGYTWYCVAYDGAEEAISADVLFTTKNIGGDMFLKPVVGSVMEDVFGYTS